MGIFGQNTVLNQYAPPFCVKLPVDGESLVYDSVTKSFRNKTVAGDGGNTGAVAVDVYDSVGNGVITSFLLPWLVTDKKTLLATIQGVKQHQNAFSISSATTTTIIFSQAPSDGDEIEVMVFLPVPEPVVTGLSSTPVSTSLPNSGDIIIGVQEDELFGMVRLPNLMSISTRQVIIIKDESGKASLNNIVITAAPGQQIDNLETIRITDDYGYMKLYAGGDKDAGTEQWFIIN